MTNSSYWYDARHAKDRESGVAWSWDKVGAVYIPLGLNINYYHATPLPVVSVGHAILISDIIKWSITKRIRSKMNQPKYFRCSCYIKGNNLTIYVNLDDDTPDLKIKIWRKGDIPPAHQQLISQGNKLRDGSMLRHYFDVIMTTVASQITSFTVVYSLVYSGADQRKHQSSASMAFVRGIHRDRWIPRTKDQ